MEYRRFGRTELRMPVFSCGGMRYQQSWDGKYHDEVDRANQANLEATIQRSLELGINHIETARGYGSSEQQLGYILPKLDRDKLIVQTKVVPFEDPEKFRETFETSMARLQLEHIDLLGFHGVNTHEILDWSLRKGGCMELARQWQKEGRVRFVGFSTHGPTDVLVAACNSGQFDYINLHWYYFDQLNWPAIEAATQQDMGVFIISPSDKGGKLYDPPAKLQRLCAPLTPMGFNDLWCLWHEQVHTLSLGAARASDFDAHVDALQYYGHEPEVLPEICDRLNEAAADALGSDWVARWQTGLPQRPDEVPGQLNLYHILRLWNLYQAYDMLDFAKMRYNLLGNGSHWFPGFKVSEEALAALPAVLSGSPFRERIPELLRQAHAAFNAEDRKRLSQSD